MLMIKTLKIKYTELVKNKLYYQHVRYTGGKKSAGEIVKRILPSTKPSMAPTLNSNPGMNTAITTSTVNQQRAFNYNNTTGVRPNTNDMYTQSQRAMRQTEANLNKNTYQQQSFKRLNDNDINALVPYRRNDNDINALIPYRRNYNEPQTQLTRSNENNTFNVTIYDIMRPHPLKVEGKFHGYNSTTLVRGNFNIEYLQSPLTGTYYWHTNFTGIFTKKSSLFQDMHQNQRLLRDVQRNNNQSLVNYNNSNNEQVSNGQEPNNALALIQSPLFTSKSKVIECFKFDFTNFSYVHTRTHIFPSDKEKYNFLLARTIEVLKDSILKPFKKIDNTFMQFLDFNLNGTMVHTLVAYTANGISCLFSLNNGSTRGFLEANLTPGSEHYKETTEVLLNYTNITKNPEGTVTGDYIKINNDYIAKKLSNVNIKFPHDNKFVVVKLFVDDLRLGETLTPAQKHYNFGIQFKDGTMAILGYYTSQNHNNTNILFDKQSNNSNKKQYFRLYDYMKFVYPNMYEVEHDMTHRLNTDADAQKTINSFLKKHKPEYTGSRSHFVEVYLPEGIQKENLEDTLIFSHEQSFEKAQKWAKQHKHLNLLQLQSKLLSLEAHDKLCCEYVKKLLNIE